MSKADLRKHPAQVAAMFDDVSPRYDRTNAVLSMGNAALWRAATTRAVGPRAGETILDIAAGTGTSSASLARNGARVIAADFSPGMIEVGRRRQADNPFITFAEADATDLPFEDDSFDAVTISFGLRNVVDPRAALAEFYRVTKPGGRVVVAEFSRPPVATIRAGYSVYLRHVMPVLARVASSNPAAYEYLMESIQAWPTQPALAQWLRDAGFERVAWRNLTAGIVALHRGWKPAEPGAAPSASSPVDLPAASAESAPLKSAPVKPATGKPAVAKPATGKPGAAKPADGESVPVKPATGKPGAAKPSVGKPASAKPASGKPAAAKPASGKPGAAKPSVGKSAPAKPAAGKPVSAESPAEKPAARKPGAGRPAASASTDSGDSPSTVLPEGE